MKKSTLTLAALATVVPATLATPAFAEPTLSVGGQLFTNYSTPLDTNGKAKQSFNVTRAYLDGKVMFNNEFSGRITYNAPSLSYMKDLTTGGTEPNNGVLELAYLQHDGLIPGSTAQFGMAVTSWGDYELSNWGYRMLGLMPTFGGIASTVTGGSVSGAGYVPLVDKGFKLSGSYLNGMIKYGLGMFNGEGYRANETDGQKSYQGRLSLAPIEGLDLTILGHKGNLSTAAQADAYSGALTYSALGAKISGQYTIVATGTSTNGTIMTGFAIVPTFVLPVDLVLRADFITPNSSVANVSRMETIAGLSYKPTKGMVIVLDDQLVNNNTVSGNSTTYNVLALHSMVSF